MSVGVVFVVRWAAFVRLFLRREIEKKPGLFSSCPNQRGAGPVRMEHSQVPEPGKSGSLLDLHGFGIFGCGPVRNSTKSLEKRWSWASGLASFVDTRNDLVHKPHTCLTSPFARQRCAHFFPKHSALLSKLIILDLVHETDQALLRRCAGFLHGTAT